MEKKMRGQQTNKFDVQVPASDVWNVYGTLILPEILKNIPSLFNDLKIAGDGSSFLFNPVETIDACLEEGRLIIVPTSFFTLWLL